MQVYLLPAIFIRICRSEKKFIRSCLKMILIMIVDLRGVVIIPAMYTMKSLISQK